MVGRPFCSLLPNLEDLQTPLPAKSFLFVNHDLNDPLRPPDVVELQFPAASNATATQGKGMLGIRVHQPLQGGRLCPYVCFSDIWKVLLCPAWRPSSLRP
uniref:Uncharacterized protein n=1 Tax=Micrurus lemniscatus lemniscatus TaxID=129467 RepID=A0A2D4J599_MICLE